MNTLKFNQYDNEYQITIQPKDFAFPYTFHIRTLEIAMYIIAQIKEEHGITITIAQCTYLPYRGKGSHGYTIQYIKQEITHESINYHNRRYRSTCTRWFTCTRRSYAGRWYADG